MWSLKNKVNEHNKAELEAIENKQVVARKEGVEKK